MHVGMNQGGRQPSADSRPSTTSQVVRTAWKMQGWPLRATNGSAALGETVASCGWCCVFVRGGGYLQCLGILQK